MESFGSPDRPPEALQDSQIPNSIHRTSQRNRHLPERLKDMVPTSVTPLTRFLQAPAFEEPSSSNLSPPVPPRTPTPEYVPPPTQIVLSEPNEFGLFCASPQLIPNDPEIVNQAETLLENNHGGAVNSDGD